MMYQTLMIIVFVIDVVLIVVKNKFVLIKLRENMITLTIIIWLVLGIHSAWFFIKRFTQKHDLTTNEIWMVGICILLPLLSHFATLTTYPNLNPRNLKPRTLVKKK
jgi:hypothetical protein